MRTVDVQQHACLSASCRQVLPLVATRDTVSWTAVDSSRLSYLCPEPRFNWAMHFHYVWQCSSGHRCESEVRSVSNISIGEYRKCIVNNQVPCTERKLKRHKRHVMEAIVKGIKTCSVYRNSISLWIACQMAYGAVNGISGSFISVCFLAQRKLNAYSHILIRQNSQIA